MSVAYPWAGEIPRSCKIVCSLVDLVDAYERVQARFDRRMREFRNADQ